MGSVRGSNPSPTGQRFGPEDVVLQPIGPPVECLLNDKPKQRARPLGPAKGLAVEHPLELRLNVRRRDVVGRHWAANYMNDQLTWHELVLNLAYVTVTVLVVTRSYFHTMCRSTSHPGETPPRGSCGTIPVCKDTRPPADSR
jgi:hypothetical protein